MTTSKRTVVFVLFIFLTVQAHAAELPNDSRPSRKSSPAKTCLVSTKNTQDSKLNTLKQTRDASIQSARTIRDAAMETATAPESIIEIRQAYVDAVTAANQTLKDARKTTYTQSAQDIVNCRKNRTK